VTTADEVIKGAGAGHGRPRQETAVGTDPRSLLDKDDVARWLCTSVRHVQRLVQERRLPYVKVGHFVRFDAADVSQWIDEQKVDGRPTGGLLPTTIVFDQQLAPTAGMTRRPTSATEVLARWKAQSR
jgi:excisionase family DNA binding protein